MQYKSSYDYKGLISAYLSRDYTDGTTASNRLSFNGVFLISYSTVVARLEPNFLIITSDSYSNTTSKQIRFLEIAYSGVIVYSSEVTNYSASNNNIDEMLHRIEQLVQSHQRARTKSYIKQIRKTLNSIQFLSNEFNIALPTRFHELVLINEGLINR